MLRDRFAEGHPLLRVFDSFLEGGLCLLPVAAGGYVDSFGFQTGQAV